MPAGDRPGGLALFWERTLGFQADRDSPFSPWGLYGGLEWLQAPSPSRRWRLALVVALVPRRRDARTVAALGAAVLIAVQLALDHWFYLYVAWFLPARPDRARPAPASGGGAQQRLDRRPPAARPAQRMSTALIHGSSSDGS